MTTSFTQGYQPAQCEPYQVYKRLHLSNLITFNGRPNLADQDIRKIVHDCIARPLNLKKNLLELVKAMQSDPTNIQKQTLFQQTLHSFNYFIDIAQTTAQSFQANQIKINGFLLSYDIQ